MTKNLLSMYLGICLFISLATSSCNSSPSNSTNPPVNMTSINNSSTAQATSAPTNEIEEKTEYSCEPTFNEKLNKKVPTTVARKPSDKRAIVQWVKQMDDYWKPQKRCEEVSKRMQEADDAGTLKFLTNGKMNGQKVICTAIEVNGSCKNILMTLRPQDKSLEFLSELKDLFNGRSQGSIIHSSGERQIYVSIDLKKIWNDASKQK